MCHVLRGKHQRFIDAGCNAGEGALNRERPGLGCGSDGGRGIQAVGFNDRSSDVSHHGDEIESLPNIVPGRCDHGDEV